jgi:hypothetical protein
MRNSLLNMDGLGIACTSQILLQSCCGARDLLPSCLLRHKTELSRFY